MYMYVYIYICICVYIYIYIYIYINHYHRSLYSRILKVTHTHGEKLHNATKEKLAWDYMPDAPGFPNAISKPAYKLEDRRLIWACSPVDHISLWELTIVIIRSGRVNFWLKLRYCNSAVDLPFSYSMKLKQYALS
jgi:hypothetical protein